MYTMEYHSATKKDEIAFLPHGWTENIMLSAISQKKVRTI